MPKGGNGAGAPPRGSGLNAGALDRGIETAVAVTTFFGLWAYIGPIFGGEHKLNDHKIQTNLLIILAIMADQYWGRFKTVCVFTAIVGIGHVILVGMDLPLLSNLSRPVHLRFD